MRVNRYILLSGILLISGISCNDVLEADDQTAIDAKYVYNDPDFAILYLNQIYSYTLPGFSMLTNSSLTFDTPGNTNNLMTGTHVEPSTATDVTPGSYAYDTFGDIRNINLFIEGVEEGTMDADTKDELTGQAYFLRAFVYWDLVLYYGGVPVIDRVLDINDGVANMLPRASAAECIDFIVSDLDIAIERLSGKTLETGRITASAAAALKGRVLLFWASPQFNPNRDGNGLATDADGIAARWTQAHQANLEAKTIADAEGHGLHTNYSGIFLTEDNKEVLMVTKYTAGLKPSSYDNSVRPSSVRNSTGAPSGTPTWDFVEAFPMKDGLPIAGHSGYDEEAFWVDRDPRFYSIIGYNGTPWTFSGDPRKYQWSYEDNDQENGVLPATGFYLRKNVNSSLTKANTVNGGTDWVEIRYAEVLLNLAESANETGDLEGARSQLIEIRKRAGIQAGADNKYGVVASNKLEMREAVMLERRIELCFENKTHFDIRRRNLFVKNLDGTSGGLNGGLRSGITTTLDAEYIYTVIEPTLPQTYQAALDYFEANIIDSDTVDWTNPNKLKAYFDFTIQTVETLPINFQQPLYNFYYLPTNAIAKNRNLKQTVNWLDGTFDPLAE